MNTFARYIGALLVGIGAAITVIAAGFCIGIAVVWAIEHLGAGIWPSAAAFGAGLTLLGAALLMRER